MAPAARRTARLAHGELALIDRIRRRALGLPAHAALRAGIGDDCAILQPTPGDELCITTDFSLEGRHFRRDWHPPRSIGHRVLARGLSDLAAMGATPMAAFLSLALPRSVAADTPWVDGFLDGLLALAREHGITLAGGDTSESPTDTVLADIVLLGSAPAGTALRRSGARAGDAIYVTGTLGGAAAGLLALSANPARFARADGKAARSAGSSVGRDARFRPMQAHLFPAPRIAVGRALRERGLASACMDLSDGLSSDLAQLCRASGVDAEVDIASLPAAMVTALDPAQQRHAILHGGEDYELLFTTPPAARLPKSLAGVRLTRIGTVLRARRAASSATSSAASSAARFTPKVWLREPNGTRHRLEPAGWEHLR